MTIQDLLQTQTHPEKARALQIALQVWPTLGDSPTWHQAGLLHDVQDVLAGLPTPTLSRVERDRVKAAAQTLGELGS